ncbi:MAG: type II toxin-antitoxin system RelE/ParE family toxin [Bacteroidales bacterium]|nr:type II toxin-antitoxin system RelE/ParE family toxin [Bacteroidales bacterium]
MHKISWGKRAFRIFVKQWCWEGANVGMQAAETMRFNVEKTLIKIQQMPTIGRLCKETNNKTYRIIKTHPKSSLYYWHNETEVRVVRFVMNKKNNKNLKQ